jgi:hypothetical protein
MKKSSHWNILIILIGIMFLLLVLHMIFMTAESSNPYYWELVGLFDMDSEISLFTWYSTVVLLFVPSVLLFYIWWLKRQAKEKLSKSWFLAGSVLLFLSIDDGAMIHEKFSTINHLTGLQDVLDGVSSTWLAWSWWVIYVPIGIVVGIILLRWFLSLPVRTRILITIAVLVAAIGQIGMESISSFVTNNTGEYVGPVWRGLQKFVGRTGLSIFLFAIIDYIILTPDIKARFAALLAPLKPKKNSPSN